MNSIQSCVVAALAVTAFAPTAAGDRLPGASFRDFAGAPVMVVVPAGRITLGSAEAETRREGRSPAAAAFERPQREARIDRPFAVGRYHVTRREFERFVKATRRSMGGCVVAIGGKWSDGPHPAYSFAKPGQRQRGDEPAVCVDWQDAAAYAAWLSARTGARYRLPTEAEWEYAARAGTRTARWWGDDPREICRRANGGDRDYAELMPDDRTANLDCSDGFAFTSPVGHFAPNPFGLHDMLGNAWQWTSDCFGSVASPAPDPCPTRSVRGGSWHNERSTLRAASRFGLPPTMRSSSLGFRLVRELG